MYKKGRYITKPIGNNSFSYTERTALGSLGKIFVPSLIKGDIDNLEGGSEIVFEEAEFTESGLSGIENNRLVSCTGLKHFIQTAFFDKEGDRRSDDSAKEIPIYIFDNHNHALSFRTQYRLSVGAFERLTVLHIDQHSDIKSNDNICPPLTKEGGCKAPEDLIENFVNEKTNVGNFITTALNSGIINEVIQIRTDYALHHFDIETVQQGNIIVDIDVDFRVGKEVTSQDIQIIKDLIKKAKIVTIATSPYFIDQQDAIKIIKKILP